MPQPAPATRAAPFSMVLVIAAVALISINLRPGATSLGPLLEEVSADIALTPTLAGVVTALPGFTFAASGALAVGLAVRVGLSRGITAGAIAIVISLLTRVLTDSPAGFIALTVLGLAGMGLGNVLIPAWIKTHARHGGVGLMTLYSMGLTVGGAIAPLVAAPLAGVAPGQWRGALALWGFVALLALVPWLVVSRRDPVHVDATRPPALSIRRSPTAIALTALFATQSMNAYVQFGWLPQIYRDAGLSAGAAGVLMSLVAGLGIIGGLLMPTIVDRSRDLSRWMLGFGALAVGGYLGLLLAPAALPWLWAILLGISGFAFPTAIALITARTRSAHVTAQVSGFVQPVGYLLAGIGPFAIGIVHDLTGGWETPLALLMLSGVGIAGAGLRVARPGYVDDEIGHGDVHQAG